MGRFRQLHLNKSGSGMASKTACGRNILRTPLSTSWADFKNEPVEYRCVKCDASKFAELNRRTDAKKAEAQLQAPIEADDLSGWIPEDADAWKIADDALIAAKRK